MTTITKNDLKKLIAEEFETTQTGANDILDKVFNVLADVIVTQQKGVKLGEIGTLKVVHVPERDHRNPQTGESVTKPEHYALKFKVSDPFKKELAEVTVQA